MGDVNLIGCSIACAFLESRFIIIVVVDVVVGGGAPPAMSPVIELYKICGDPYLGGMMST